ncbi:aldehyde dehydrogenase family protein [Pseudoalteromonas phenolica]|uniref:Succinate-semialdehyde dehydrogenase n=1 Tax=Pseudoalteromonas phenolica TaxID=161398 RepID=A0A0S2K343_9GAMM|nr:aldehyde dehydrogenase family protein [Pseudoalteromonas phenolica]ALO42705.1 Succinate-semialdehyde dehydrogenase [Pseudoalteromonas phenolica]MBE0356187.1 hypothetical protein [Pseudoalteromonas phenolica O-BC30]RXF01258.1 aldehyde dehydrogenase [Pseudoalteromonas phenolica O-BC30]
MTLISYDPSNGLVLGEVSVADQDKINATIAHAKLQQLSWRQTPIHERSRIISQAFKALIPFQDELAELLCKEMGKSLDRGTGEVRGALFSGSYYAAEAAKALAPQTDGSGVQYRPLGVCAVISPWNYPLAMAVNLFVPALVAGNTVVFKPSEETPLIAERFTRLLNQYLPEGILNILHGDGEVGSTIVAHESIDLIAFTGSQAVGKQIMASAASSLKRLIMELGGNDPMIVLEDANIKAAAQFAVASSFENAGQMCTSTERIYVAESISSEFIQEVTALASQYRLGSWNETHADIGPIINAKQVRKIQSHIDDALRKGAHLLLGGHAIQERYIEPTVISGITHEMVMEQQETFGPVVAISTFQTVREAIARANDSTYGLGAVVFGNQDAQHVAAQLEAGMIGINKGPGGNGDSPWIGAKQSGFGFHGSVQGHRQFAQMTVVS